MVALLVAVLPATDEIQISNVEGRVKDRNECIEKFKRKYKPELEESGEEYLIQNHITDLVGLRVICLYEDMVPKIREMLEEVFEVFDVTDKISEIEGTESSFGYKGLHLDVRLKNSRRKLPEYVRFGDINFEIQLRTVIQDSWSTLDHKIKYKKSIPKQLKRRINTLAALFELADHEFVAIRDKTFEEVNRPDSNYEAISNETPTAENLQKPKKTRYSPLDVFSFLKIANHFFPQYDFDDEEIDNFVQFILNLSPEISRGKFNFYLRQNIATAKRVFDEFMDGDVEPNQHPLPVIRLSLYLGDKETFGKMIGAKARERVAAIVASADQS
ncbi:(p)ppGpp synthetase [Yoonia sp. I 8.24]|nr:(p)ppGpp synthetase [Yoonia sp. I 8.24]